MLFSKHWNRVAGVVLAALAVFALLTAFDLAGPYHTVANVSTFLIGEGGTAQQKFPDQLQDQNFESQDNAVDFLLDNAAGTRKTIVVSKLSAEDTTWTDALSSTGWTNAIYVTDLEQSTTSSNNLKTTTNKGKEAMPYLTFIVEHYYDFPDFAVFLNTRGDAMPSESDEDADSYKALNLLPKLKLGTVDRRGFVNLRCTAKPGCPIGIPLEQDLPDATSPRAIAYAQVYAHFFNMTVDQVWKQVPMVSTPCCAQFAVSRTQVLSRSKAEYQRYLTYIEESDLDNDTLGTVMEYMWHVIFGMHNIMCESEATCAADLYGGRPVKAEHDP